MWLILELIVVIGGSSFVLAVNNQASSILVPELVTELISGGCDALPGWELWEL